MSSEIVNLLGNTAYQLSQEPWEEIQTNSTPEAKSDPQFPNRFHQGFRPVRTVIGSSAHDFFAVIMKQGQTKTGE